MINPKTALLPADVASAKPEELDNLSIAMADLVTHAVEGDSVKAKESALRIDELLMEMSRSKSSG